MVKNMNTEYQYAMADEAELDTLLSGNEVSSGTRWSSWSKPSRPRPGSVGVVWHSRDPGLTIQPLVLIVDEEDIRRLCGRYAQLHSDLSPLSTWCHLLTPRFFEPLESLVRVPDLAGLQAAWTGLVVAEAVLLAQRPLANIKISACLATHSFAIARTIALWHHVAVDDVTKRFDNANRLVKSESLAQKSEGRASRIRASLQPIWDTLIGILRGPGSYRFDEMTPVALALHGLMNARSAGDPREANHLIEPLLEYAPEAESLRQIDELAPEDRLRVFDGLVEGLSKQETGHETLRQTALGLLAGYLATIAAGGAPSLTLAEGHASRWPEITAWAYLTGGLGEKVVWTSSFDGLGRLVARELLRPLRLDEPPTCDFAFDEAIVLADGKLADPLVHLKVKQARLLTVEILPGVNVSIPIGESGAQDAPKPETSRFARAPEVSARDPLAVLADAMWPHIRRRLDDYFGEGQHRGYSDQEDENAQRSRGRRKSGNQPGLPLNNPKRY